MSHSNISNLRRWKIIFCHQNTKTQNFTNDKVLNMSFGGFWWPGDLVAFLFAIFQEILYKYCELNNVVSFELRRWIILFSYFANLPSLREPKDIVAQRRERPQRKKCDNIYWLLLMKIWHLFILITYYYRLFVPIGTKNKIQTNASYDSLPLCIYKEKEHPFYVLALMV